MVFVYISLFFLMVLFPPYPIFIFFLTKMAIVVYNLFLLIRIVLIINLLWAFGSMIPNAPQFCCCSCCFWVSPDDYS